jgi:L-ribulokinase
MTSLNPIKYQPIPENEAVYHRLYRLYRQMHDAFGGVNRNADLSGVMKELIRIREEQTQA